MTGFKLPRAELESPASEEPGASDLGVYEPGGSVVVYDPTWLKTGRSSILVLAHEDTHQLLTENTAFGLATQFLRLHRDRSPSMASAYQSALRSQWSVQELAATFTELTTCALSEPDSFEQALRSLPSALLGAPPYREVLDAMTALLPLEPTLPKELLLARQGLVIALAAHSMNAPSVLDQMSGANPRTESAAIEARVRAAAPDNRFESLINELLKSGEMDALAKAGAETLRNDPTVDLIQSFVAALLRGAPGVPAITRETMVAQSEALSLAWTARPGKAVRSTRKVVGGLPELRDSPEKAALLREFADVRPASKTELRKWLRSADKASATVNLILGPTNGTLSQISAVAYPAKGSAGAPDDLRAFVDPNELLEAITTFKQVPHIATFVGDAWAEWYSSVFGRAPRNSFVHARFQAAIRIATRRQLSEGGLRSLFAFEDMGRGPVSQLLMTDGADLSVALFTRSFNPGVYSMQKLRGEAGQAMFHRLLDQVGVSVDSEPAPFEKHLSLLKMIVQREFSDPRAFTELHER